MLAASNELLTVLLKATSRSFYLTLRVLPAAVRSQIGLAYLLARTTDTIADTELVPPAQRLHALGLLRERILGRREEPGNFTDLAQHQGLLGERMLLENIEAGLALLKTLSPADLKLVREVLATIIGGQELDLRRFGSLGAKMPRPDRQPIIALETAAELDDYTYRVAGCVGEFWTKLCRARLFPRAHVDEAQMIRDGIRFGKGLQLVNILRDLPVDLKAGRCYLPVAKLAAAGLVPETLLSPANEAKFLPCYHEYLDQAAEHLAGGWDYTNALPFSQFRVRLACAWPVLIGAKTIEKLRGARVIELQQRVKVTRGEVRMVILRSILSYPVPGLWRNQWPCGRKAVASGANLA